MKKRFKERWKSLKKWKRALIITGASLLTFIVVLAACISFIAEYLIEKYDVKYTGREIEMDWMAVNIFTGYAHIDGLKIYEYQSDSIFFSANGISVDLALNKLFSKTYTIESLTINKPYAKIIQNKRTFNFDDLIEKFSPDSTEIKDTTKPPTKFNLLNVKITNGEFHYIEHDIPVNYFVKKVNVKMDAYRWDVDTVAASFDLENGPGSGKINGDARFNLANMDYQVGIKIDSFDLQIMEQYIQDLANYGRFRAMLDLDVLASGNINDEEDLMATGMVKVSDIHFGKTLEEDYASLELLHLQMRDISPRHYRYVFDSVILKKPYFKYERYDDGLDNIQTMFGRNGSNIKASQAAQDNGQKFNLILEIADFVEVLAQNFLKSYFRAGRVAVYDADIRFNDYALTEQFALKASPLTVIADSIDKNNQRFTVNLRTSVNPSGNIHVGISVNPQDFDDFDISYDVNTLPMATFNPYLVTYTGFPADRGTIELKGNWHVADGQISSQNNLLVLDPRFADRLKHAGVRWLPMRIALSILRSRANAIDYEIPITGNLKNPSFNVWDVIGDILTNIFVKPPSIGYIMKTRTVEREIEKSLTLKWEIRSHEMEQKNKKFMKKMRQFLEENPEASITVQPMMFERKEREAILFFEAKKKFFYTNLDKPLSSADSIAINKMSIRDERFEAYLKKQVSDSGLFTIQEKCMVLVGADKVNAKYNNLLQARKNEFISYFGEEGLSDKVKITAPKSVIPFNGFSYYKIDYKGDFPDDLLKAYYDMNDLNDTRPRKKYENKRENLGLPAVEVKQKPK